MYSFEDLSTLVTQNAYQASHALRDQLKQAQDNDKALTVLTGTAILPLMLEKNGWAASATAKDLLKASQNDPGLHRHVITAILHTLYPATQSKDAVAHYIARDLMQSCGIDLHPKAGMMCRRFALSPEGGTNQQRILFAFPDDASIQNIRVTTTGFNGTIHAFNRMAKKKEGATRDHYIHFATAAEVCAKTSIQTEESGTENFLRIIQKFDNKPAYS